MFSSCIIPVLYVAWGWWYDEMAICLYFDILSGWNQSVYGSWLTNCNLNTVYCYTVIAVMLLYKEWQNIHCMSYNTPLTEYKYFYQFYRVIKRTSTNLCTFRCEFVNICKHLLKSLKIIFDQFSHHFQYFETFFNLYGPKYLYFLVLASPPVVDWGILGVHSLYVMSL